MSSIFSSDRLEFERAVAERMQVVNAFNAVFSGPDGEIVLDYLRRASGRDEIPYVSGKPDDTAYNAGRLAIFVMIINTLRTNEEQVRKELSRGKL